MPATFSQIKSALDEIAQRIAARRSELQRARTELVGIQTDLTNMATAYSAVIADINAFATANPNDAAAQTALAEKNQLVAEFTALKNAATAGVNAIPS